MTEKIQEIAIDSIDAPNRLRAVDPKRVEELCLSISERGLMQPIEVRPVGERFHVTMGAHRLEAMVRLRMKTIPARVLECTADEARLREIDENLYRAELTALDQAMFLQERRQVFERINGPVKAGRPDNERKLRQLSFFDETAQRFGLSRNVVKRALTRVNEIHPTALEMMRGTRFGRTGAELDALRGLSKEVQINVVAAAVDWTGRGKASIAKAIALVQPTPPTDAEASAFRTLMSAWRAASAQPAARRRFIEQITQEGALRK